MFDIFLLLKSDNGSTMSDMSRKTVTFTLGERIRKAREDKGWQQADLADGVKKSRATIAAWEGDKHRPSKLELDFIADLTDYPIEFFTDLESSISITRYRQLVSA